MRTSPATGLPIIEGADFGDQVDDWARALDEGLARRVTVPVQSLAARDQAFPPSHLGAKDYASVYVQPNQEIHEWDGTKWLISDTKVKTFIPYWYTAPDVLALTAPSGQLTGHYRRLRGMCSFGIQHVWTTADSVGVGNYLWRLPFPAFTYRSANISARISLDGGVVTAGDGQLIDSNLLVVLDRSGNRFPTSAQRTGLSTDDWWAIEGVYRTVAV